LGFIFQHHGLHRGIVMIYKWAIYTIAMLNNQRVYPDMGITLQ